MADTGCESSRKNRRKIPVTNGFELLIPDENSKIQNTISRTWLHGHHFLPTTYDLAIFWRGIVKILKVDSLSKNVFATKLESAELEQCSDHFFRQALLTGIAINIYKHLHACISCTITCMSACVFV
jgi:hypothetical protein